MTKSQPNWRQSAERELLLARELQRRADKLACEECLAEFVWQFWNVIEPMTPLVWGWVMDAICEHLEAVTYGDITRLLMNVPPGSAKSILVNVFWPAWVWTMFPHKRFLSFSYAAHLTERDNRRFRDIIQSPKYQSMWGDTFTLTKKGEEYVANDKTGFKVATSVGGVGTGERGDFVLLDDPHNVKDNESDVIRRGTVNWFSYAMSNRLNDMQRSAIVVIMQRVHEEDVSGHILENSPEYTHLCIPAEYEPDRHCSTVIGWDDPRRTEGQSFWPERFPVDPVLITEKRKGPFYYAGQFMQRPEPAGGGVIKREWWKLWEPPAFPPMDFIIASLDTAYTEKEENDPSALTIWGVFSGDATGQVTRAIDSRGRVIYSDRQYIEGAPKAMLMNAWTERLELHELVRRVSNSCRDLKVNKLLIESKAVGISVAQELRRLNMNDGYAVQLIDPGRQDKLARLYSVQHLFAEGMVYAPDKAWAEMTISQVGMFPKGKHDDIVDTLSMALRHLRDLGLLTRAPERLQELENMQAYPGGREMPLYPS